MDRQSPRRSTPRLVPGIRRSFDEERCRMRLDDIGVDVVPRYLYADGMQEIYAILLGEYGRSEIADAISVLHELLEDDSYEGYIWRSWRHGWRHRNDDLLNPFVPAVGDFVLPPPTNRVIRALRAANFFRAGAEAEALPPIVRNHHAHEENRPSYIPCSSASHSKYGDFPLINGFGVEHDTPQAGARQRHQDSAISTAPRRNRTPEDEVRDQFADDEREVPSPRWTEERNAEQHSTSALDRASHVTVDGLSSRDSQQVFDDVSDDPNDPNLLRFELMINRPQISRFHRRTRSDPTGNRLCLRPTPSPMFETEVLSHTIFPGNNSLENLEWHVHDGGSRDQVETGDVQDELFPSSHAFENESAAAKSDDGSVVELPSDGLEHSTALLTSYEGTTGDQNQQFLPDIAYVDDNPRMSLSNVRSHTVERTAASITTVSDHGSLHSSHAEHSNVFRADHHENAMVNKDVLTLAAREGVSPTPGRFLIDSPSEDRIGRVRSHKRKLSDQDDDIACSAELSGRAPRDGRREMSPNSGCAAVPAECRETPQNKVLHRGHSFLRHIPKIFRKERENKQTTQQSGHTHEHSSTTGSLERGGSRAGCLPRAEGDSSPKLRPNRTGLFRAFDGACDDDDTLPTMSSVDLNKALPPQPLLLRNKDAASRCTGPPSLTLSCETNTRPSTASTASSNLSQASSKNRFHRTTHQLVHPEMADSRDLSPLREDDSDRFLVPSKYDPLASPPVSPKMPDTPMTFSSFNNSNPFMDQYNEFIPPVPVPAIPEVGYPDPIKTTRGYGIPQSRSEGQIHSPKPSQAFDGESFRNFPQSDGTIDNATRPRGRTVSRDIPPLPEASARIDGKAAAGRNESRRRSRSPVKRFLGIGKSQSMKEIPREKEVKDESDKKAGLKLWGDRLRHGFLTNTASKVNVNSTQPETSKPSTSTPTKSTFPISIPPIRQAKLFCELELMIIITANKFLKSQRQAGLMSPESVAKITYQWRHKNRPQVVEFQFDQATQRDLILYNINTFRFHGEARTNPLVLNATMYAWKVMAKEMSVRTFCTPDSVIRKHLHDTHKVIEMLGGGLATFLTLQELQVEALKEIAEMQKKRVERQRKREKEQKEKEKEEKEEKEKDGDVGLAVSKNGNGTGSGSAKTRKFTPPTPTSFMSVPMSSFTVDEETLFEDPYEG